MKRQEAKVHFSERKHVRQDDFRLSDLVGFFVVFFLLGLSQFRCALKERL